MKQRTSPNHAMQRTAPAVTPAASTTAFPPTVQPARQPAQSLSLGSLGDLPRAFLNLNLFTILTTLLLVCAYAGRAEQPSSPASIQALANQPTLALAPQNLKPGDQAVLVITFQYENGQSKPIKLKPPAADAAFEAVEVFEHQGFHIDRKPNSSMIRVYRVSLKTDTYTFTASDFENLPPDFKLPELKVYREKT